MQERTPNFYTAEYVQLLMEEAGTTLLMLPATGIWPAKVKSCWPDVANAFEEAYGWTEAEPPKLKPTMAQMDNLDLVIGWLPLVTDKRHRQVLKYRMLVSPRSGKHLWSWRRIADAMDVHHETAKSIYDEAIHCLTRVLNLKKVP